MTETMRADMFLTSKEKGYFDRMPKKMFQELVVESLGPGGTGQVWCGGYHK